MSNLPDSIVNEALSGDDEIRQMIRDLMKTAIEESKQLILYGNEATKINAIRNLMPSLVRALSQQKDANAEAVGQIKEMLQQMQPLQGQTRLPSPPTQYIPPPT